MGFQKLPTSMNGKKMISARKAAERIGCASDYIGKLCREGRLQGELVDRAWFVESESVTAYKRERDIEKADRAKQLSEERKRESESLRAVQSPPAALPFFMRSAVLL